MDNDVDIIVHLDHPYFFQVEVVLIRLMTYSRRLSKREWRLIFLYLFLRLLLLFGRHCRFLLDGTGDVHSVRSSDVLPRVREEPREQALPRVPEKDQTGCALLHVVNSKVERGVQSALSFLA